MYFAHGAVHALQAKIEDIEKYKESTTLAGMSSQTTF